MKKNFFIFLLFFVSLVFAKENEKLKAIKNYYLEKNYESAQKLILEIKNDDKYLEQGDEKLFCLIYDSKIELEKSHNSKSTAQTVLNNLELNEKNIKKSNLNGIGDSFYSLKLFCNVVLENTDLAKQSFENIKKPDENSVFLISYCFYNYEKDYEKAFIFLEKYLNDNGISNFTNSDTKLLYAKTFIKKGDYNQAEILYSFLENNGDLSNEEVFEYAKLLFVREKYQSAYVKASSTNHPLKDYLCGLCFFNMREWEKSKKYFSDFLLNNASVYGYIDSAKYYKAYSMYKLSDYKNAYKIFSELADTTTELNIARNAYELAAKSAVQEYDFSNAAIQAEKLIKISFKNEEKEKAVYFCAQIYFDSKDYDKAYEKLSPYLYENNDFSLKCYKLVVEIYKKNGDIDRADSVYEKIIKNFPNSDDAQEALYKRGELFFINTNYSKASKYYSEYISKYSEGHYLESALYFCGESYLKLKDYTQSVIQNKKLINKFPKSIYLYGAYNNLFNSYFELDNYEEAKKIAEFMIQNYKTQAISDGIPEKLDILEQVNKGISKESALKREEYSARGGVKTLEGRLIGYELFELYLREGNETEAKKIGGELLNNKVSRDENEFYYLGEISDFFAKFENGVKKADLLLQAVEFYRKSKQDTSLIETVDLYSAVDAFLKDKKIADARETAQVLKNLYPNSRQAQNVDRLF